MVMMKDLIVEAVVFDLNTRSEIGIKKYKTTLTRKDYSFRDWVQALYEEQLDAVLYTRRIIDMIDKNEQNVQDLIDKIGDDI